MTRMLQVQGDILIAISMLLVVERCLLLGLLTLGKAEDAGVEGV